MLAILAVAVLSATVKRMDIQAGSREAATLQSLGNAFQQSVLRNRYIPSHNSATNWATAIAAELGTDAATVTTNGRFLPRYFLIDPALQIGTNVAGQAYSQSNTGSTNTPTNPRFLIVSSIGGPTLPLTNGVPSSAVFNGMWNWNETAGGLPSGLSWTGSGPDLKVQRVNLASSFVRVVLNNYLSSGSGQYMIDPSRLQTNSVPNPNGVSAYFLKGSVLRLLEANNTVDADQVLERNTSFNYIQNVWRGEINPGLALSNSVGTGLKLATPLADIAGTFATSINNANALNHTTPSMVLNNMNSFMTAYNAWANAGFPTSGAIYTAAKNAQTAMQNSMSDMVNNLTAGGCTTNTP